MSEADICELTQKFSELDLSDSEDSDSEDAHWNSFGSNKLFKSFKTTEDLKKYIVKTNTEILNTIKDSKIETSMDKVLDEETIRILNLKKF